MAGQCFGGKEVVGELDYFKETRLEESKELRETREDRWVLAENRPLASFKEESIPALSFRLQKVHNVSLG
ncbi:hypothetical protein GCM10027189_25730 [Rufibacter soli]